jgi:nanoRNase/pAp phosphatase (c-di-AMP/oligoRNAs hydrolase)
LTADPNAITAQPRAKLDSLVGTLSGSRSVLILTHDNPDPDSISAGSCLKYLLSKLLSIKVKIGYGGIVGRAENRAMLRLLRIHTTKLTEATIRRHKSIILVDAQPWTGNNSLPRDVMPVGVIDHHPQRRTTKAPFTDIRPDYGAVASILTEYLLASGLDIPSNLATALFYGIASETRDLGREVSDADKQAYLALIPKTNWKVLSKIRRPRLEKVHFAYIARAIANASTYKHAVATCLGRVDYADILAEVAEMLLNLKRMSWSLCTGRFQDTILISLRTSREKGRAATVARRVVGANGTAGGHDMIAGGQIDCTGKSEKERDEIEQRLIDSFFKMMGKQQGGDVTLLLPTGEEKRDEGCEPADRQTDDTKSREEVKR